jgi:REP element-mobilizing transposase RayT
MNKQLVVYAYVIMLNHFHIICQAPNISSVIQSLKRHTAKMIIKQLKIDQKKWVLNHLAFYMKKYKQESDHQLWQEGFHPKQIQSDDMFRQKAEYIHENPVRRGFVSKSYHWVYSSAGDYNTDSEGMLRIEKMILY